MWIIPSRSRPQNIQRLVKAFNQTLATSPALLWLDNDDPFFIEYMAIDYPPMWQVVSGLRRDGLAEMYNDIFKANPDLDWYGFLADDVVPETMGWDIAMIRAAGRSGVAYADDGINGEALGTHPVIGGDLVRSVGWLALPGLKRLYIDTVWNEIGRTQGCIQYLPDVKLTHHHFSNRMALRDAIYRKPNKKEDAAIFEDWKETT